jgi:hypothetical protein
MAVPNSFDGTGHVLEPASTFQSPGALRGIRAIGPGAIGPGPTTAPSLGAFGAESPAQYRARGPR